MDDQTNIELIQIKDKILKNTNDIYALNLWKKEVIARLDQGIENRTKAFEKIEVLEKQVSILKDLLDRYFTLEINEIEKSHGKRKWRKMWMVSSIIIHATGSIK